MLDVMYWQLYGIKVGYGGIVSVGVGVVGGSIIV